MWFWLWLLAPRHVEVPLGRVADFCPLCRFVKPFEVVRIELAQFDARRGTGVKMFLRCTVCSVELDYEPSRYRAVVKVKTDDLAALIAETFPNVQEVLAPRLALEQRIRDAPESLGADERADLIREPMRLVAPSVLLDRTGEERRRKRNGVVASLAGFMLLGGGIEVEPLLGLVATVLLFGGLGYTVTSALAGPGRRLRRMLPVLAKALRPLRPSREELSAGLRTRRVLRRRLSAAKLERALEELPALGDGGAGRAGGGD